MDILDPRGVVGAAVVHIVDRPILPRSLEVGKARAGQRKSEPGRGMTCD
jgi:hypothetical protein